MKKLSAPIYQLKRRAKLLARSENIQLHNALDQVAREEGFAQWSLLKSQTETVSASQAILSELSEGDLLLVGARPGHGKTMLGLQILLDAVKAGRKAVFFTLEFTEAQAREQIQSVDTTSNRLGNKLDVVTSDDISADFVISYLSKAERGTVAVIDYLQILDQQRTKPPVADQVAALQKFAREAGVIIGFISQIDRAFELDTKRLPDLRDVRLPNLVDLSLFSKACFLHDGQARLQDVRYARPS